VAYSPPAWNAVDFSGTGQVVSAPRWDRVNFVTPPASLAWSDSDIAPDSLGEANHQYASGTADLAPDALGEANHQHAFSTADIAPDALGEAWRTFFASVAGDITPDALGRADMVYSAAGDASLSPLAAGTAVFVYLCQSQSDLLPDALGEAYRPTSYAAGLSDLSPDAIGIAVRGVSAFGIADLSPDARGDLVRLFRCSVDAAIFPESEAIAAFSPSPKPVWCSFVASIAPHAIGITSA
jgi:hypothetical protein